MKITCKTLQQQTVEIEIDASATILKLKEEIYKSLGGDYKIERQKLICVGVVLDDDSTLESYNINESKMIVVMLQREIANADVVDNENENVTATATTTATTTNEIVTPENLLTSIVPDADALIPHENELEFLVGEDYVRAVNVLMEMGYEPELIERAMAAGFNNPERAFEYLTNGIPNDVDEVHTGTASGGIGDGGAAGGVATHATDDTNARQEVNTNAVNQVLELLRQNPELLRATLEQMGVNNPELLNQIRDNADAFFSLLQRPTAGNNRDSVSTQSIITPQRLSEFRDSVEQQAALSAAAPENANADHIATRELNLTQADHAAIDRLKSMGFPGPMALQAYIAFEKDETAAANFLATNHDSEN